MYKNMILRSFLRRLQLFLYGKVTDENMASYEIDKNVIMFIFKDDSVTNISLSRGLSDEEL